MTSRDPDVVVCGGGIGGSVLAEMLARRGKRVLVLERTITPPTFLRPEGIWPPTIETLCALHAREIWESEAALPMRGLRASIGNRPFFELDERVFDEAGVRPWMVNPNDARELLLRRASFELRRGVEVLSVLRDGERVAGLRAKDRASGAEFDVAAEVTIGDDGEHSIVREGCGIQIATTKFPFEFLCFALDWPEQFEPAKVRVWIHPEPLASGIAALAAMPFVRGKAAGLVPIRAEIFDALEQRDEVWNRFVALDPEMRRVIGDRRVPHDLTRVTRRFGHAERYGVPGAFLIGDAAHPVSPAGGQGANMSIADARVLAELIASEHRDVLAEYERIRRPPNERSLGISRAATRVLGIRNRFLSSLLFGAARLFIPRRFAAKQILRGASRTFVESAS